MARDSPKHHSERCHTECDQDRHPERATEQKFLDIRLADCKSAEGSRFRPIEEDEQGIQLILVGDKKQKSECERYEKL